MLASTGNLEIAKDILPKQINYLRPKAGINLIKHVMKSVDLLGAIDTIEERFIAEHERAFIARVLESLSKGQTVRIRKIVKADQNESSTV